MNTTENNKIIAEFMGMKPINKNDTDGIWNCTIKAHGFNIVQNLSFNSDWNWLMEVVQKINIIDDYRYTVQINSMDTYIHDLKNGGFVFQSECKWQPDELINSVYQAVVEFIKWYKE